MRKPKIALDQQLEAIRAISQDFGFVRIADDYIAKQLPEQHVPLVPGQPVPMLCTRVASLFRKASLEFLRRGSDGTEYRARAKALQDAVQAIMAEPETFLSRMVLGDGGACARHALWALDDTSKALFRIAKEVEQHDAHAAFGLILGRTFQAAGLKTPTVRIAADVYARLQAAVPTLPELSDTRSLRRALARGASPDTKK
ncbi:hypothetical protein [Metallibacterium sp.]|uniref:hypothetical protein n=1 Tax=Metallibacterium sp. TaxID=2940281 RepID=UPI00260971F7|nr:hypothetical protein [Metallibacterium sp.]